MPVSLLLCEGKANSPDMRVLCKLLAGRCEVRSVWRKVRNPGNLVKGGREAIRPEYCFWHSGWRFPGASGTDRPGHRGSWIASDGVVLGWRWEAQGDRELPDRSGGGGQGSRHDMRLSPSDYTTALQAARDRLTLYQAARRRAQRSSPTLQPAPCSFGRERGRDGITPCRTTRVKRPAGKGFEDALKPTMPGRA